MKSELLRFGRGFIFAWNGIRTATQQERNFRFHLCASVYVILVSWLAELSTVEWCLIFLCIAAVLGMELMNSAIERAVDKPDTTHWWSAGAAKDMAAGGVLLVALGALAVGLCLFAPRLPLILENLCDAPWILIIVLFSIIPAYLFIFRYYRTTQKGEEIHGKNNS